MSSSLVNPVQELLEMLVNGQGFGLVNELETRTECRNQNATAAAVAVAFKSQIDEVAGLNFFRRKRATKELPIRAEAIDELEKADPALRRAGEAARH